MNEESFEVFSVIAKVVEPIPGNVKLKAAEIMNSQRHLLNIFRKL